MTAVPAAGRIVPFPFSVFHPPLPLSPSPALPFPVRFLCQGGTGIVPANPRAPSLAGQPPESCRTGGLPGIRLDTVSLIRYNRWVTIRV